MLTKNKENIKTKITKIEITNDTLTGRGGLFLFKRYLDKTRIINQLSKIFSFLRKSSKGQKIGEIFKQLLLFFIDGTSFSLVQFDKLKEDRGYAKIIESKENWMLSSHAVKRFFKAFSYTLSFLFRKILTRLFIWRLQMEKPEAIKLGIDTMVMDNDDAKKKEGVEPTYKKKKGFQPIQVTWGNYIVDAIFRSGEKHSNYSDHVVRMIKGLVNKIRKEYSKEVPILLRADTGFYSDDNFQEFDKLEIGFIVGGRIYEDIKEYISQIPPECIKTVEYEDNYFQYIEFGNKRGTWPNFRRAFYTKPLSEEGQLIFDFDKPENIIYTNIGQNKEITKQIISGFGKDIVKGERIIIEYKKRGADELVHKGLKDFGTEKLPFKKFGANAAYYYVMVLAFFIFESFKKDVSKDVIPIVSFAKTVRRKLIDFAVKIVYTARQKIVKVTQALWEGINIPLLWERCNNPPMVLLC